MKIQITQEDIDNLATKLDEFTAVLNERERSLLRALFIYAHRALEAERARQSRAVEHPPLSASFRRAVEAGSAGVFEVGDETDEEFIKIVFHKVDSPREVHREVHKTKPGGREVHKVVHKHSEGGGETTAGGEVDTPVPTVPKI